MNMYWILMNSLVNYCKAHESAKNYYYFYSQEMFYTGRDGPPTVTLL